MTQIAISFSGGGFRASSYHLGTLSYLNHLKSEDGRTFLELVNAMSTISGGTLTGLWYMMNKCREVDTETSLKTLFDKLASVDIIGKACKDYFNASNNNQSFIKELTKIYDELFFDNATFGIILDRAIKHKDIHFSANTTDLYKGLQFRFQASVTTKNNRDTQGICGNYSYRIPNIIASQIHLSEIFAASSCVPGGFEPLIFPNDFNFASKEENAEYIKSVASIGLVDGAVTGNQGIGPISNIAKRTGIDLFIISDVCSSRLEPYVHKDTSILENWSIHKVNVLLNISVLAVAQFLLWVPEGFCKGFFTGLTMIALAMRLTTLFLSRKYIKKFVKTIPFRLNWKSFLKVSLNKYINLISTRAKSLFMVSSNVFMKQLRRLDYATIYENDSWKNRRIMNAIYELQQGELWYLNIPKEEREFMRPTDKIERNSKKASEMGTTLWFTEEDKKNKLLEAVVAAGQYNICWNLLEYIINLKKDNSNTNENHQIIIKCEKQLREDWEKFKENPFWLLETKKWI